MKPFDYELAKQKGVKLCTADGRAARIVCHDMKGHPNEMVVIVETKDRNEEIPLVYYKNGRPYSAGKNFHLRIQSEPRYLNVKEKIVEILKNELSSVYCYNCTGGENRCEDCYRKNMNWALSDNGANKIADKILERIKIE